MTAMQEHYEIHKGDKVLPQVEDFDTATPPHWEKLKKGTDSYYTSFSGMDTIVLVNGASIGSLYGFEVKNDASGDVNIDFEFIRFEKDEKVFPKDSLMVVVYANEYGRISAEAYRLANGGSSEHSVNIDTIIQRKKVHYWGWELMAMTPIEKAEAFKMDDESFAALVKKAKEITPSEAKWLSFANDSPRNNVAHRVFYILYEDLVKKMSKTPAWKKPE